MKNILILTLMFTFLLSACKNGDFKEWAIISKLPIDRQAYCEYHYRSPNGIGSISFMDSCNKYDVGDTIKHY